MFGFQLFNAVLNQSHVTLILLSKRKHKIDNNNKTICELRTRTTTAATAIESNRISQSNSQSVSQSVQSIDKSITLQKREFNWCLSLPYPPHAMLTHRQTIHTQLHSYSSRYSLSLSIYLSHSLSARVRFLWTLLSLTSTSICGCSSYRSLSFLLFLHSFRYTALSQQHYTTLQISINSVN